MALIKTKQFENGTEGNYWIAEPTTRKRNNKTEIIMLLYKDKATRETGYSLYRENLGVFDGVYLSGEEVYAKVKESRMSEAIGEEGEEGYVAPVELNFFADATDDI